MKHPFAAVAALLACAALLPAHAASLATVTATASDVAPEYVAEGVVEAVRQSAIAAQVPSRIVEMRVRAGDTVKAGQVMVRLDARTAVDQLATSRAQVAAAQAQLDAARREYERNQRLFEQRYISQAAMDLAQTKYKAAQADAQASLAQAGVAATQSTFTTLTAPYNGIVASVSAEVGDLASPGVPLVVVYDPAELRVVAALPESHLARLVAGAPVRVTIPGAAGGARTIEATSVQPLPIANATTHTRDVRLGLPAGTRGVAPGMFARAAFPLATTGTAAITLPLTAVVRRPEYAAVYVVDAKGQPQLRQVRLGRTVGERVEIAAGVAAGEVIAVDALAAARQ